LRDSSEQSWLIHLFKYDVNYTVSMDDMKRQLILLTCLMEKLCGKESFPMHEQGRAKSMMILVMMC